MSRYTIEYRAPRHTKWHALSVSALALFPANELARYRQEIAENLTRIRGEAIMADMVRMRVLKDGAEYDGRDLPARNESERAR